MAIDLKMDDRPWYYALGVGLFVGAALAGAVHYAWFRPLNQEIQGKKLELDNGHCRNTELVSYFVGRGPGRTANCKINEVDVPLVVGMSLARARIRLGAQPLTPNVVYKPARAKQRLDLVLDQFPRKGRLSSYDTVTLVLAKPLHGVVPKLIGLSLDDARRRLRARGLVAVIERFADGRAGRVLAQRPVAGVAGAPRRPHRNGAVPARAGCCRVVRVAALWAGVRARRAACGGAAAG